MCGFDCPATHPKIKEALCGMFYPFGSAIKCGNVLKNTLKNNKEFKKLHEQWKKESCE